MEDFLKSITGKWQGAEKMWVDPAAKEPMQAQAKFENKLLIGGEAIGADYQQTVNGDVSLTCFTLIRATDDKGGLEWVWAAGGSRDANLKALLKTASSRRKGQLTALPLVSSRIILRPVK